MSFWLDSLCYLPKDQIMIVENDDFLKTMVSCINALIKEGYSENYKVTDKGLKSFRRERIYNPTEVKVVDFFRFEGNSDPDDNSILYAIETSDGGKGTLVDAYGTYADSQISSFMEHVHEIHKKVTNL